MTVSNSIQMTERASAPDTPATNAWRVYFKSGGLYVVDDAGTETGPLGTGGGGGSGASDAYTVNEASDYTTSSTSFVDIDATDLNLSLTTTGGDVLLGFYGNIRVSGSGSPTVYFDVLQDATRIGGDDGLCLAFVTSIDSAVDQYQPVSFTYLITGLSAGTYAFKLQWKVSAAAAILYAGAGTSALDIHPQFWAKEIA